MGKSHLCSLVVDDFGVRYDRKQHAEHIIELWPLIRCHIVMEKQPMSHQTLHFRIYGLHMKQVPSHTYQSPPEGTKKIRMSGLWGQNSMENQQEQGTHTPTRGKKIHTKTRCKIPIL